MRFIGAACVIPSLVMLVWILVDPSHGPSAVFCGVAVVLLILSGVFAYD